MLQNLLGLTMGGQASQSNQLDNASRSAGIKLDSESEKFSNSLIKNAVTDDFGASDAQSGAALIATYAARNVPPDLLGRLQLAVENLVEAFAAGGVELPQAGSDLPPLGQFVQKLDGLLTEEFALQNIDALEPVTELLAGLREILAQVLPSSLQSVMVVPAQDGNVPPAANPALSQPGAVAATIASMSPAVAGTGGPDLLAAQSGLVQSLRAVLGEVSEVLAQSAATVGAGFGRAAAQASQAASAAMKVDSLGVPLASLAGDDALANGLPVLATQLQRHNAGPAAGLAAGSAPDAVQPAFPATASATARLQAFVEHGQRIAASLQSAQTALESGAVFPAGTAGTAQAGLQPGLVRGALLTPVPIVGTPAAATFAASLGAALDATGAPVPVIQAPFSMTATAAQPLPPSPMAATFNTDVALPVLHQQWGQQLAQRISWFTGQGINSADIQLNPPELGPMQVRIDAAEQSARVTISVHSSVTREALEAQLPRLRDLFANQGMDLVDVDVNSGEYTERQTGEQAGDAMAGHEGDADAAALAANGDPSGQLHAADALPADDASSAGSPTLQSIVLRYAVDAYA